MKIGLNNFALLQFIHYCSNNDNVLNSIANIVDTSIVTKKFMDLTKFKGCSKASIFVSISFGHPVFGNDLF